MNGNRRTPRPRGWVATVRSRVLTWTASLHPGLLQAAAAFMAVCAVANAVDGELMSAVVGGLLAGWLSMRSRQVRALRAAVATSTAGRPWG